jgi:hypothetical protein
MLHLGRVVNPGIAVILQSIEDGMLLIMSSDISLPGEFFLLVIIEGARQLGIISTCHATHIVWAKEMVKQEHVSVPSIPGT